jgi:UDP-N-acetylglucosamine--N-acetylmuramyl-(pentapeptide) pyrophosphoryl-undecaprenol N-acetylglucosamine transferase
VGPEVSGDSAGPRVRRLLLACGGTGGHVTPAIALAQRWAARGNASLLAISAKAIDGQFSSCYPDLEFIALPGRGFSLKIGPLCRALGGALRSFGICLRLIRSRSIAGVVAFGGFTSLGPCLAAFLLRRPIFLFEANRRPGKAIRFLSPLARRVYVPATLKDSPPFRFRKRFVAMDHPLRSDFIPCSRSKARERLCLPRQGKLLLVMGGSQGAQVLVRWVDGLEERLAAEEWHCVCLTGPGGLDRRVFRRGPSGRFFCLCHWPFCSSMHLLLSAADLAVCRAGAGTVAELTACATPAVLVPYPFAAHDHQTCNALAMERMGAALHWPQDRLGELWGRIGDLCRSGGRETLRENLLALRPALAGAAERLAAAVHGDLGP